MTIKLHRWLALLTLPFLSGCYPEGAEYVEELDLVLTNYDDTYDFSSKTTYAMPDSIIKITGDVFNDPDGNGKPQMVSPTFSVPLLQQIDENMAASGWQKVSKTSNPDVILLVSGIQTTNLYYYYDWWYWGWWYPGWYPGWGWYYPYVPVYVDGYRSGSLFIQMIDAKAVPQTENVPVVWSGIFNGMLEGSNAEIIARVQTAIDKAFAQSPYLKH